MEEVKSEKKDMISDEQESNTSGGFFSKYGPHLFLGGLIAYLILLGIGVVAEIFKIEAILDWWIWRPPGK